MTDNIFTGLNVVDFFELHRWSRYRGDFVGLRAPT